MFQKLRKSSGMTQKELAIKLGVTRTTIAMWETGKSKPRTNDLYSIANILGVSVDKVLDCFKPAK